MGEARARADLSVLHIGAGRYSPKDRDHATFAIWRALSSGFRRYTVVGRADSAARCRIDEDPLSVRLLASRTPREFEFMLSQFKALDIAEEVEADVVVSQCPALGGVAATRIARHRGAKVLLELHMANYMQPSALFSKARVLQAVSSRTLKEADRIRVLSRGMKSRLISMYGEHLREKTRVLPPRVDLKRFATVKANWAVDGPMKLIIVGSVNARKGQLRLIRALYSGGFDGELWIVGTGPDLDACRALAVELGARDKVRCLGQMSHNALSDTLPQADALICYSSMEGTPRAIMEGMAVGLPIITTDAGFCADIVEDRQEGFVLRGDPDQSLPAAIRALQDDHDTRAAMGKAACERARREFDADMLYDKYRALIRETAAA